MKTLKILMMMLMVCGITQAQNYVFNDLNNPDPDENSLEHVELYSDNTALLSGFEIDLYYNGNEVSILPEVYSGSIYSFSSIEENEKKYALCAKGKSRLILLWNDSLKEWKFSGLAFPYDYYGSFLVKSDVALFVSGVSTETETYTGIFKLNLKDSMFGTFSLLKKIYGDPVGPVFNYNGDSVIFTLCDGKNNNYVFSYDYDTTISQIDVINYRIDGGCTFNKNNFYFLSWKNLIKWNSKTFSKEIIYENEDMGNDYNRNMFMVSDDCIIFSGSEGIAKFNISEKKFEVLRDYGSRSSSYNPILNKAIFVGGYSITEMTITDGVITFQDKNSIKLYPNPATDKITIESNSADNKIEIYNNLGQNVYSCYSAELTSEINVSEYPTGIYFVKLSNQNGKVVSTKFIKN